MRSFLRHPSSIPVELRLCRQPAPPRQRLHNISLGGIACNSPRAFRRGATVELRIRLLGDDVFCAGVVAWCQQQGAEYLVGVAFTDQDTLFRARMVEQVCQIEHYRLQREQELGVPLCCESIAAEWVAEHAAQFGQPGQQQL
ncbi:PilZ domain-containing protein [Pseudomonas sp.]|uniref:PilZ domain-containing protein n=1 Tax=Pseudomonas sp. TaxID=306 RepID=UPI0025795CB5|nr:PilZ domain-containing protein [Pseudomonas sp.]